MPQLRQIAIYILTLSIALQAVLMGVGEAHELSHDSAGVHIAVHEHKAHAHINTADVNDESPQPLHELMHSLIGLAHCSGHMYMAIPASLSLPMNDLTRMVGFFNIANFILSDLFQAPFRPPIFF